MLNQLTEKQLKKVPELAPGDTVRVHAKIIEGNKERIQIFEGVVLRVKGSGMESSITVRKISYGIGVERVFLLHSPKIAKIQVIKRAKVRQAYLTYLRALRGKSAKLRDKQFDTLAVNVKEEELKPEDLAPPAASEELDKEITEIDAGEAGDINGDESTEEIAEAEAKSDITPELAEVDEAEAPEAEVEEGLDKAEADAEKGENHEGQRAEKIVEEEAEKKASKK